MVLIPTPVLAYLVSLTATAVQQLTTAYLNLVRMEEPALMESISTPAHVWQVSLTVIATQ